MKRREVVTGRAEHIHRPDPFRKAYRFFVVVHGVLACPALAVNGALSAQDVPLRPLTIPQRVEARRKRAEPLLSEGHLHPRERIGSLVEQSPGALGACRRLAGHLFDCADKAKTPAVHGLDPSLLLS